MLLAPLWVVAAAAAWGSPWVRSAAALRLPGALTATTAGRLAVAALLPVVALAGVVRTVAEPPPLHVREVSVDLDRDGGLWRVRAAVTNRTARSLEPHFAVTTDADDILRFWWPIAGSATLGPGTTATYTIVAPGEPQTARPGQRHRLCVVTDDPPPSPWRVSRSARWTKRLQVGVVGPLAVDPLPPGQPSVFALQLRDARGREVRRAGVPVTLEVVRAGTLAPVGDEVLLDGAPLDRRQGDPDDGRRGPGTRDAHGTRPARSAGRRPGPHAPDIQSARPALALTAVSVPRRAAGRGRTRARRRGPPTTPRRCWRRRRPSPTSCAAVARSR